MCKVLLWHPHGIVLLQEQRGQDQERGSGNGLVLLCSLLRLMVKESQGVAAPKTTGSASRFSEALGRGTHPSGQLTPRPKVMQKRPASTPCSRCLTLARAVWELGVRPREWGRAVAEGTGLLCRAKGEACLETDRSWLSNEEEDSVVPPAAAGRGPLGGVGRKERKALLPLRT